MINNPFNSTSNLQIQEQERRVFNQFIQNAGSKTALEPKGRLVHENPIQKTVSGVKDFGMDVVNLGKALKDGDSCDHYLGRLNDLGMKLGGLGIATYLFTRKVPMKSKLMEFIGAATFFATMSLWPKIFIAAPIKARFGFDINQKYIDSQGRKKDLYQDNQYVPKLETKEELQKAADRLHIPKDMEYREEYALEKRRKIALQARTLWMLTAGFATPLLTALACNRIEKYADKTIITADIEHAKKEAANLGKAADKKAASGLFDVKGAKAMEKIKDYKGVADDAFLIRVAEVFNPAHTSENGKLTIQMPNFDKRFIGDLKKLFTSGLDDRDAAEKLISLIEQRCSTDDQGKYCVPTLNPAASADAQQIRQLEVDKGKMEDAIRNVMYRVKKGEVELNKESIIEALSLEEGMMSVSGARLNAADIDGAIKGHFIKTRTIKDEAVRLRKATPGLGKNEALEQAWQSYKASEKGLLAIDKFKKTLGEGSAIGPLVGSRKYFAFPADLFKDEEGAFTKFIEDTNRRAVPAFLKKLETNYAHVRKMNAIVASMDDVVKSLDNSFGKEYFGIVDAIFDVIKPDENELRKLRANGDYASDFIQAKFQEIVKDTNKLTRLVEKINNSPVMAPEERQAIIDTVVGNATKCLDDISKEFSPEMSSFAELSDMASSTHRGFVGLVEKYVREATNGIDATKDRINLILDLEMRAADGTLKQQWAEAQATAPVKQSFETFLQDARRILYKSTMNDFSNTQYLGGNGAYYQKLNDVLFNKPMSENSVAVFESAKNGMSDTLTSMRIKLMAIGSNGVKGGAKGAHAADYVNVRNAVDPNIIKHADPDVAKRLKQLYQETLAQTDAVKYQMTGKPLKNFIFENASQKFNSKAWMKIFAPMAIALVGVTLLAQLFIGRDTDKDLYMRKNNNTGANNGN